MVSFNPANRVAEYANEYAAEGKEWVEEYPLSTAMIAFGLGIATGVALVSLLSEPESSRHYGVTHRLGSQILDAVASVVPQSVARSFGH